MCGMVGLFGDVTMRGEGLFSDLLNMDVIRGPHSTGVALMTATSKAPQILKAKGTPENILGHPVYDEHLKKQVRLMMGHNRFATIGKINKRNAHPFRKKHITLMHNGTLTTVKSLPVDEKFETDSETICHAIAEKGVDEAWKGLQGAAMLVWWDNDQKSLNFLSNEKRPFHFAVNNLNCLVWASESWMLRGAAKRRTFTLKDDTVFYPTKNVLFSFKYVNGKLEETSRTLEEYKFIPLPSTYSYKGQGNSQRQYGYDNLGYPDYGYDYNLDGGSQAQDLEDILEKDNEWVNPLPALAPHQRTDQAYKLMDVHEFKKKYHKCMFCEKDLSPHAEYLDATILDENAAVCGGCTRIAEMNNIDMMQELLL